MTVSPRNREFIAAFQSGSFETVKQLCQEHYAPLLEFATPLTPQHWTAHSIVVDTFIKLLRMREQFDNEANIKAFLYITVRNRCRAVLQSENQPEENGFMLCAPASDTVHEQALAQLHKEVAALPEKCRRVFEYSYGKRLTLPEIAEQLEMDQPTLVALKEKAVRLLHEALCGKHLYCAPVMIYFIAIAFEKSRA